MAAIELQLWDWEFAITALDPTLLFARVALITGAATSLVAPDKAMLLVICVALS
jgi:hypothetical protein